MPLDPVAQQLDFSSGMFQAGALEREPTGAAETIRGLIGEDGLPYRRGGSLFKGTAFGSSGLLSVWSGRLPVGLRTWLSAVGGYASLGADDATPGLMLPNTVVATAPRRAVVVAGMLAFGLDTATGTNGTVGLWGGSYKTNTTYNTGTVTATTGSRVVTGSGTTFGSGNVDKGSLFFSEGSYYVIASVDSNTQITLLLPYTGAGGAGLTYTINTGAGSASPSAPDVTPASVVESVANRLLVVDPAFPNIVRFSAVNSPLQFAASDYHSFPAPPVALGSLRDVALVFTTAGLWAISNIAYSLTDAATGEVQHRKELVNGDLIAWANEGVASWSGALVVPCLDNVYLVDSLGAPTSIGDRILDLYLSYVRAGYKPGVAEVFNGHYFLPILTSGNVWVDTLVCRLRPTHSGVSYGWSQFAGEGAEVSAFSERPGPDLIGASRRTASRLLSLATYFQPSATVKSDADATAHDFQLATVDYPTGGMVSNFVHKVRLVLALSGSDAPTVAAEVSVDGGVWTALSGTVAVSDTSKVWRVNRHAKNVRFRFTSTGAAAGCKVKSVEVFVRHSGRQ